MQFVLPSVAGPAAVIALAERQPALVGYWARGLAAAFVGLIGALAITCAFRPLFRRLDRHIAGIDAGWLEGREIADPILGRLGLRLPPRPPRRLLDSAST